MTLAVDGTPAGVVIGTGASSATIGPLSTTFAGGYAIVSGLTTGNPISNIVGGGLNFTSRVSYNPGPTQYIEEWVAPISAPLNNVTLTINFAGNCSYISYSFFAVSNGGNPVAFDTGGPQTAANTPASMTTNELAFVMCFARFGSPANAPTASAPWAQIYGGVANSFFCVESQLVPSGTYTGLFSDTTENGSIIDALYAPPIVSLLTANVLMPATWM